MDLFLVSILTCIQGIICSLTPQKTPAPLRVEQML